MNATSSVTVDCRGMRCPAPILEVSKAARRAGAEPTTLRIEATDGDFPTDLRAWCRSTGATLAELGQEAGAWVAVVHLNEPPLEEDDELVPDLFEPVPLEQAPAAEVVDCVGMRCPAPILEVAKRARALGEAGGVLEVRADDGDFPVDIRAWARTTRAEIVSIDQQGGAFSATIRLGAAAAPAVPQGAQVPSRPAAPTPTPTPTPVEAEDGVVDLTRCRPREALMRLGSALLDRGHVQVRLPAGVAMEDLRSWAEVSGAELDGFERGDGGWLGTVRTRPEPAPEQADVVPRRNHSTLLVLRNDFESLMAALMVANASAAQGMTVDIYFSFWGVNLLRGESPRPAQGTELVKVSFLQNVMKWMMPKGPDRQQMSKMHMGGVGLGMMKYFMRQQNVLGLRELMLQAVDMGVKFKVCTMSMGIMGITRADLMDLPNLEFGGVTAFTADARTSASAMVF